MEPQTLCLVENTGVDSKNEMPLFVCLLVKNGSDICIC